jgi:2-amino-4-hydroxy-6-hydroxymethyldihydropteridine diphosphokinase
MNRRRRMRVVVGMGANLGDRLETLVLAVAKISGFAAVRATAPLFETAPVGPSQPDFLNSALLLEYEGTPRALLEALLAVERDYGRERRERWGPRTLDLDVLWIDGVAVGEADLEVPHARLAERRFALEPLLALVPEAAHPTTGETYRDCVERLPPGGIRLVAGPGWASSVQAGGNPSGSLPSAV